MDINVMGVFTEFYKAFPEIFHAASGKFDIRLSWTHYRVLLQVNDPKVRDWYLNEAAAQTWSVRTLQRNISSQYYHRLLQSQNKDLVEKEMLQLTAPRKSTDSSIASMRPSGSEASTST